MQDVASSDSEAHVADNLGYIFLASAAREGFGNITAFALYDTAHYASQCVGRRGADEAKKLPPLFAAQKGDVGRWPSSGQNYGEYCHIRDLLVKPQVSLGDNGFVASLPQV